MGNFTIAYPPKILFGMNSISQVAENIPAGSKILLAAGGSFARSELMGRFEEGLSCFEKIRAPLIGYEAPVADVQKLIDIGRREKVTAVVAVGGGSVIDAAKSAAGIIPAGGECIEYFHGKRTLSRKGLFFAALPTTAGSGAEITQNAVLTDTETRIKKSIRDWRLVADLAVVDPLLTVSMPQETTACSGMDALTQAIESYISASANPVSMPLAEKAVGLIMGNLAAAYADGGDIDARTLVAQGSLLSAMSFSQSGLGAVHGLAHPIGSLLSVPHGKACAILLPRILEFNLEVCRERLVALASRTGSKSAESLVEEIRNLMKKIGIPSDFSGCGLNSGHFDFIARNCRSRSMESNPRHMGDENVLSLLRSLAG